MLTHYTAFLIRSLRQESRYLSHHVLRGFLALFILLAFSFSLMLANTRTAVGSTFVSWIVYLGYFFVTMLGSMYFSIAITEEKEEGTLPLLTMTGVSRFALLSGKSLPRMLAVILFMLVITPFVVLSITLGGVVPGQLLSCLLAFLCFTVMLSQLGLFCSTICKTGRRAVALALVAWLTLEFGYVALYGFTAIAEAQHWNSLSTVPVECAEWLAARTMWNSLSNSLAVIPGDRVWQDQMSFHLVLAAVFFVASWLVFEYFNGAEANSSGESQSHGRTSMRKPRRAPAALDALMWKSWQFGLGGIVGFSIRLVLMPAVVIGMGLFISLMFGRDAGAGPYIAMLFGIGILGFLFDVGGSLGRVFNEEHFRKTLVGLLLLPRRPSHLLFPMIAGLAPTMAVPLMLIGTGFLAIAVDSPDTIDNLAELFVSPWLWQQVMLVVMAMHIGVLLSLSMRYAAMLVSIVGTYIVLQIFGSILFGMLMMLLSMGSGPSDAFEVFALYIIPSGLIVLEIVVCVFLQRGIVHRVVALGAQ